MNVALLLAQLMLGLIAAPLLNGIIKSAKAGWQNRRGPALLQPWYDIRKYLAREDVTSEHASWLYRWVPYVYFGAFLAAMALVPTIMARSPLGSAGDVLVLVALFVLARFALALAALDTASNFGGMGDEPRARLRDADRARAADRALRACPAGRLHRARSAGRHGRRDPRAAARSRARCRSSRSRRRGASRWTTRTRTSN